MNEKICIFDIDGVLNYYPDCWVEFVNEQSVMKFTDLNHIKKTLPYSTYKTLKYEYRTCGIKENLKVREGACETLKVLKERGYYIILLSSRPVNEVNSLIIQTTNWLKKNNLIYDYLLFEKEKPAEMVKKFDNIEFVVEDNRAYAMDINALGHQTYLVDNIYNKGKIRIGMKRISKLNEILKEC